MKVDNYIVTDDRVRYVPYQIDIRADSMGYGFIDLKNRPSEAMKVVEARELPELQLLLREFSLPSNPFFSIGCEKAAWKQDNGRYSVRGYVEFSFNFPVLANFQNYETLQKDFGQAIKKKKVTGLSYFEWRVAPMIIPWVKEGMHSCTLWIKVSDIPSRDLALRRYNKAVGLLTSYFKDLDIPHTTQSKVFEN